MTKIPTPPPARLVSPLSNVTSHWESPRDGNEMTSWDDRRGQKPTHDDRRDSSLLSHKAAHALFVIVHPNKQGGASGVIRDEQTGGRRHTGYTGISNPVPPGCVSSVCVYLRDITPYEHIKLKYSLSPMNPVTYIQHGHTYPLSGLPPAPLLASLQTSHFRPDQNPKGLCPESRG